MVKVDQRLGFIDKPLAVLVEEFRTDVLKRDSMMVCVAHATPAHKELLDGIAMVQQSMPGKIGDAKATLANDPLNDILAIAQGCSCR